LPAEDDIARVREHINVQVKALLSLMNIACGLRRITIVFELSERVSE